MITKVLTTPISFDDIKDLRIGDSIYINGLMVTGRDEVHQKIVKHKNKSPINLNGNALFHAGPIVKKLDDGYEIVSVGPTTSMRMEKAEYDFIKETGVRVLIGKGGMGEKTAKACKEFGAIHTVYPGGCAVLAAKAVEAVDGVEWQELGMPEALWVLRVKNFGPLVVSIDTEGNNLFQNNKQAFGIKKDKAVSDITDSLDF